MSRLRSVVLTIGAVVGSLFLLGLLAGWTLGIRPVVVQSGSMSPSIPTGSLAFGQAARASEAEIGDVVVVRDERRHRVMHRVVSTQPVGGHTVLHLRGDANPVADPVSYTVDDLDIIRFHVPWLGYPVTWLATPWGLVGLGMLAVVLLLFAFRRTSPPGGRRKALAAVAVPAVLVAGAPGADAAFGDAALVASGAVGAATAVAPTSAGPRACAARSAVLGLEGQITLRWNGVATPAQPRPQAADYEYVLRFYHRTSGAMVGAPIVVQHAGAAGAEQSFTQSGTALGNLLGLNLLSSTPLRAEIRSRLTGTTWESASPISVDFTSSSFLTLVSFSCT